MSILRHLLLHGQTLRDKTIVHVGAHYGQEAARYQSWGAKRVLWFEALPNIHEQLIQNLADLRKIDRPWFKRLLVGDRKTEHVPTQALLADTTGEIFTFHLFNNSGASNSIFRLSENGGIVFPGLAETGETVELPSKRLDDELARLGVPYDAIDALVIDVQGAELKVLMGAPLTLEKVKILELEVSSEDIYTDGVLVDELDAWLRTRGFVRRTRLRRTHMNAVYTRN